MSALAEALADLRKRAIDVLGGRDALDTKLAATDIGVHPATVRRFLWAMPIREDSMAKIESWVEREEARQVTAQEQHNEHNGHESCVEKLST